MLDVVTLGIDLFVGMVMIALPMVVVSWIQDKRNDRRREPPADRIN